MSHELRTPLNAILGFSEILLNGMFGPVGSPKYSEYARDIHESGKHLLNVINDILDMSKIEAGHMKINSEMIDLAPLIEESTRLTAIPAQEKHITVRQKVDMGLKMLGDRRAMKQILLNLLSNAVKFTNEGGHIELRARQSDKGLFLTIADTGIGIPKSALGKIGQPFEQVQSQYAKSKGRLQASASPSPDRSSICMAARCAFARGRERAPWCRSTSLSKHRHRNGRHSRPEAFHAETVALKISRIASCVPSPPPQHDDIRQIHRRAQPLHQPDRRILGVKGLIHAKPNDL